MIGALAGAALRASCAPRARALDRALDDPGHAQTQMLARVLRAAAGSGYGRSLGLREGDSLDAFRAKVPVVAYDELEPWIRRQREGERNALVNATVVCYEKTSGSAGPAKYIPYTEALLNSFRSLFRIWAHDLLAHRLQLRSGRVFMSVSPHFRDERATPDGTPVGLDEDSEYLGPALRTLIARFLVVPPRTRLPSEPEQFRDVLATLLLASRALEVASIWSPTYLLVLLEHFERNRAALLPALAAGRIERGGSLYRFVRADSPRLALLERDPVDWQAVWPQLQLVSCWASAASAAPARRLQKLLPDVLLQPKGLLATEAPVTLPLVRAGGCVPLVDETLLEFFDGERSRLVTELDAGAQYEIILSQCGGLLRYRIGDRVQVTGRYRNTPLLEFIGRAGAVSDLVGEKLSETFVSAQLDRLGYSDRLALLVPSFDASAKPHYVLLAEDSLAPDGTALDAGLQRAHHYRIARQLGQLEPARATAVPDLGSRLHRFFNARGQAAGDIKDRRLIVSPDLALALLAAIADPDERR